MRETLHGSLPVPGPYFHDGSYSWTTGYLKAVRPDLWVHLARPSRAPGAGQTSKTHPQNSSQTAFRYPARRSQGCCLLSRELSRHGLPRTPWFCSTNAEAANLGGGTGQNSCSECRTNAQADADRMIDCGGTSNAFRGIGDDFATSASHCIRLKQGEGCDWTSSGCDDFSPADGWCDGNFYQTHGWRNHIQILRFYWDILDTSTDGGLDDTNLQMFGVNGFATAIEAMPCSAAGAGTDGNCNEFSSSPCNPLDANGLPVSPMTGSRDAYNPFDFAQFIPLNQDQERALNCVAGAGD